ncbi:hypothetical protein H0H92_005541, partial [Tricholoma furcatifolium]
PAQWLVDIQKDIIILLRVVTLSQVTHSRQNRLSPCHSRLYDLSLLLDLLGCALIEIILLVVSFICFVFVALLESYRGPPIKSTNAMHWNLDVSATPTEDQDPQAAQGPLSCSISWPSTLFNSFYQYRCPPTTSRALLSSRQPLSFSHYISSLDTPPEYFSSGETPEIWASSEPHTQEDLVKHIVPGETPEMEAPLLLFLHRIDVKLV